MANPWDYYTKGRIQPVVTAVTADRTLTFPDRNIDLGRVDELGLVSPVVSALTTTRTLTFPDRNVDLGPASLLVSDSGWILATLSGSWTNYDSSESTWPKAKYRKDPTGRVSVRGLITGGAYPSTALTLPVGYRPSKSLGFVCYSAGGACLLTVSSAGVVAPQTGSGFLYLDAISFFAD